MAFLTLLALAAAAFASPLDTRATGGIELENGCSQPVFYQVVNQQGTVVSNGELYTQSGFQGHFVPYGPANDGQSIKLCFNKAGCAKPYQFESTVKNGIVYYDFSAINGDPFKPYGSSIIEADSGNYKCPTVNCPPGNDNCAYQFPNDNSKVHACNSAATLQVQLCAQA